MDKKTLSRLYKYCVVPFCVGIGLYALIFFVAVNNFSTKRVSITIDHNDSAALVLWKLQANHVVWPRHNMRIAVRVSRVDRGFHAGRYTVSPAMPLSEVFATLMEKRGLSETSSIKVLVQEGATLTDIAQKLDDAKVISASAFLNYVRTVDKSTLQDKYDFLPDNDLKGAQYLEGYLYPDTYAFTEAASANQILDYMLYRFQQEAVPLFAKYPNKRSMHAVLTLASIVEKEAEVPSDRPIIAGVFLNRIKKWVHLGSCPTVKYALGKPHKRDLLYKDLEVKSPYNTYRNYGLPPGPICSPGKASILAALQPTTTDYFYFFAKGDGTHIFSKTLEEHLQLQRDHRKQELQ